MAELRRSRRQAAKPTLGMARTAAVAALIGVSLVGASTATGSASVTPMIRQSALAPGVAPSGSADLGPIPATLPMGLRFTLAPSHQARLNSLLDTLQVIGSPEYHHYLAPGQFDREFGPAPSTVAALQSWAIGEGLRVQRVSTFS